MRNGALSNSADRSRIASRAYADYSSFNARRMAEIEASHNATWFDVGSNSGAMTVASKNTRVVKASSVRHPITWQGLSQLLGPDHQGPKSYASRPIVAPGMNQHAEISRNDGQPTNLHRSQDDRTLLSRVLKDLVDHTSAPGQS